MKCMVLNFNGTTRRDDALVGHDTVIVIKDKKVVKLLFIELGVCTTHAEEQSPVVRNFL